MAMTHGTMVGTNVGLDNGQHVGLNIGSKLTIVGVSEPIRRDGIGLPDNRVF